jgi:hypothetical protein
VLAHFRGVTRLEDIHVPLYPDYSLDFKVYYLENFMGLDARSDRQ